MKSIIFLTLLLKSALGYSLVGVVKCSLEEQGSFPHQELDMAIHFVDEKISVFIEKEKIGIANIRINSEDQHEMSVVGKDYIENLELTYKPNNFKDYLTMKGSLLVGEILDDNGQPESLLFTTVTATCKPIQTN